MNTTPNEGATMNYCPYCRYDLRPDTCANCGQIIGHLHCFCSQCGTPVPDDEDSDCKDQVVEAPKQKPTPPAKAKPAKAKVAHTTVTKRATCLLTDRQRDFLERQAEANEISKFAQLGTYANAAIAALNLGRDLYPDITPPGEKGLHKMAYLLSLEHEAMLRKAGHGSVTLALRCYIEQLRQATEKDNPNTMR